MNEMHDQTKERRIVLAISSFTGFGSRHLALSTYVPYRPLLPTQIEPTIFDQVYGGYRQRPTSINLNTQRAPVNNFSRTYIWNPSDIQSRKLKTKTFFDTAARREQPQPKAVTPPSSDYTDAYLSAFAPKPFPTRRIYRIAAPVFANVAPVRTFLPTDISIKTSPTRFNNMNTISTSNSFERIVPSLPTSSSTYSTSFIPDIPIKYESVSNFQPFLSSPPTSSSIIPTIDRSNLSAQNVHQSLPSFSSQLPSPLPVTPTSTSPTKITYKPAVVFQAPPLPFSTNIGQGMTNERTVASLSNTAKHVGRPETLIFQHDEDITSSSIGKPSPLITPSLDSPVTRSEEKPQLELTPSEELSTAPVSSKPIEIIEQTINKYDTIIDQISAILASVSPLSSTVSSMSPGKSALDYEMTSDGSPILPRKQIEHELPQQSTMTSRAKGKYLIRDDSYDKIITAIADLDNELTPSPENEPADTIVEEKTEHRQFSAPSEQIDHRTDTTSSVSDKKKEMEILSADEQQSEHPVTSISSSNSSTSKTSPLNDTKLVVESTTEVTLDLLYPMSSIETRDEVSPDKKNGKRVRWGNVIVNSEDDESLLSLSLTDEVSSSDTPVISAKNNRPAADDQHIIFIESTELLTPGFERRIPSSSSPETSSSVSDSIDRQTTSPELNESRSSQDEHIVSSESPDEIPFVPAVDPSNKVNTDSVSLPIIESPIDTLSTSISTRYVSSDVYHGYLGDHAEFIEVSEVF